MTRLSVIVPGYNAPEKWWRRSLDSVRRACGSDDEIICVDDGSKIKPVFLNDIAKEDIRVKPIFLSKNGGQSAARNAALCVAKGEWVTFVDSDDEIVPSIYDACFKKTRRCDVVLFGVRVVWEEECLYKDDIPRCNAEGTLSLADIESLYNACLFEYPVNKVYRRVFLDGHNIRFDAGVCPGEDTIFNLRCVMAKARYGIVPSIGYIYYRYYNSSLARHQTGFTESLRLRNKLWHQVKKLYGADVDAPMLGELSEEELFCWDVQNDWRSDSPLAQKERWRRLVVNRRLLPYPPLCAFLRQVAVMFARKYLYFRFVRRMRIRRMFPNVLEMK